MPSKIIALWFGKQRYLQGLSIQEQLFNKLNTQKSSGFINEHFLCLFEHFPAYTVGLRSHLYSEDEEKRLVNLGAEFHRIKRGGMITFHGPGQLVAYPVFNLRSIRLKDKQTTDKLPFLGVKSFVDAIEETIIRLLSDDYGIPKVSRTKDTGVWVENQRKIAAIGIQVRNGITSHGLALNCNTDLKWFNHIVPCGLEGKECTSISEELNRNIPIESILNPFCAKFENIFDSEVQLISDCEKYIEEFAH